MKLRDRGYVEIELDKTRHLKIDFRAARLIEKELGRPLSKLDGDNVGITEMIIIFWASLAHEFKVATWNLESAEDLMLDAESIQYVMAKIGEAIQLFFGESKPEKN
jgi:hypothetical protein